jgi:hydrogenase 3 maturation protease
MTLCDELESRLLGRVVVVGVGNPIRGDDAAGCLLTARLNNTPRARVITAEEVPENVLGLIARERPDTVMFVDAVDFSAEPGAVAIVDRHTLAGYHPTTHRVPLALLMAFLERECGADVLLLAIQPRCVEFGSPVSAEVAASVEAVAATLSGVLTRRGSVEPVEMEDVS